MEAATPTQVVATGHDFATTVRMRLTVTPGTVGLNRFAADVVDYDTGRPVNATGVTLTFTLPGNPDIGSTLALRRSGSAWTGSSTVLSMQGRWNVKALVQERRGGVQVPLTVQTRLPQEQIQVSPGTGSQPTLYTIQLAGGNSLQGYLDRKGAGPNTAKLGKADSAFTNNLQQITDIVVPSGSNAAMAASASGRCVSRNGNADSGQITCVALAIPLRSGEVAPSLSSR